MKNILLVLGLGLFITANSSYAAIEPFTMADCELLTKEIKKKLPSKIDQSTTRNGVKCEAGKTKPVRMVLLDSITSSNSPNDWKAALANPEKQEELKKLMCKSDGYTKFLPYMDLSQQLTVNGVVVGTIDATEKKCASVH